MSDATDDAKSFGAFKKSSEPDSVVNFWKDIKDGFILAKDIGDVDKMSADDRNELLRSNKDVILATLLAFSHLQRVLSMAELEYCIGRKYLKECDARMAHSQAGEASNPADVGGAGGAPDCTKGEELEEDCEEDEEQEEDGEQENEQPDDDDKGQEQEKPEAAGQQEQQVKGAAEDKDDKDDKKRKCHEDGPLWTAMQTFIRHARTEHGKSYREAQNLWKHSLIRGVLIESISDKKRPRSLIVVLLLMNYMGLSEKHNDKLDVLELFAGWHWDMFDAYANVASWSFLRSALLMLVVHTMKGLAVLEQPRQSVYRASFCMSYFASATKKPTYLYANHVFLKVLSKHMRAPGVLKNVVTKHRDVIGRTRVTGIPSEVKQTQHYTPQFAAALLDSWQEGCGEDTCTGCDNVGIEFFVAKEQYDEAAQIRELFAQPIDWSEDVTRLS
ncbi:unnamed protein product [Symbiodinium sp. CCMP2592]|nr:unnamed protein product [Symbiodinium sp. CCMP2592]